MSHTQRELDALCRNNLSAFFQRAWRELEPFDYTHNWHIDCIAKHIEAVERGELKRLIINVPPRTGKTLLVNIITTAWLVGRNPGVSVIGISYAQRLSEKIAYKTRILMETDWYKRVFPECGLDPSQSQKSSFMTTKRGGRFSSSVGGTLTGEGANYLIIDDPVNPAEALSDVERVNSNEWIDQAIYSRLNNPKEDKIIMIMQRLHDDDPTGHLIKTGDWHLLKLPAFTNEKIIIELGDDKWEYEGFLHEERLPKEVLDGLLANMGSYAYSGQYSQEPVPLGGGEFKTDWIQYYASKSLDVRPCNIYILMDAANSKKKYSDYTAIAVWALAPDQNYYLVDGLKLRLNATERIQALFDMHKKWNEKSGKPPRVGTEEYGMMSDTHYIEKKQKEENYRFGITVFKDRVKKEERIRRLIPPMENRHVYLPDDITVKDEKGLPINFISDIVDKEMLLFPFSAHDDFIDAMARLFDMNPIFPKMGNIDTHTSYGWEHDDISVLDI